MTPRTPQGEVFCPLLSSFEHSGVPEDSKSPLFQVLGFTPTLDQVRVATPKHVIIGQFEMHETIGISMALQLQGLLKFFGLIHHVIIFVKDEGNIRSMGTTL
jgi:hypothetical protein